MFNFYISKFNKFYDITHMNKISKMVSFQDQNLICYKLNIIILKCLPVFQ